MGRYNSFLDERRCLVCGWAGEVAYQADVGVLEWLEVRVGDDILGRRPTMTRPQVVRPPSEWGGDFVAHGVGRCDGCGAALHAELVFEGGRFCGTGAIGAPVRSGWVRRT